MGCSPGANVSEFPELTGAFSRPASGLTHVIIIHAVTEAIVDPAVPYTSHLELLKLRNLQ